MYKKSRPERRLNKSNSIVNDRDPKSTVKPLAKSRNSGGFVFEQVKRRCNVAIYKKRQPYWPENLWTYEVIQIQTRPEEEINGKKYPSRESYPSSEAFGKYAWTYSKEEEAWVKFREMVNKGLQDCARDALGGKGILVPARDLKPPHSYMLVLGGTCVEGAVDEG